MATCKECGTLLPMDYFLIGVCRKCLDTHSQTEYDTDITEYNLLGDNEDD